MTSKGINLGASVVHFEIAALAVLLVSCNELAQTDADRDSAALLAMHESVLDAHRSGDVESWMKLESDSIVVANRGIVSFPTWDERKSGRAQYLDRTRFSVYRDLRPPIVTISDDGSMGWLIAEVEIRGMQRNESGFDDPISVVYAWIELYRKTDGRWLGVGNVSNMRETR